MALNNGELACAIFIHFDNLDRLYAASRTTGASYVRIQPVLRYLLSQ